MTDQPARHYGDHNLGPRCRVCRMRVPRKLANAGILTHPCCAGVEE